MKFDPVAHGDSRFLPLIAGNAWCTASPDRAMTYIEGIALIGDGNRRRAPGGIQGETIAVTRVRKFGRGHRGQPGREETLRLGEELPILGIETDWQIWLLGGGILSPKRLKLRRRELDGTGCLLTKYPPWQDKDEQHPDGSHPQGHETHPSKAVQTSTAGREFRTIGSGARLDI